MSDPFPDPPAAEQQVQNLQLGDRAADNARLVAALETIADRVNAGSSGYKAPEWLGMLAQPCKWSYSKLKQGTLWAVKRFNGYEKRMAKAAKARAVGRAVEVKAEADAELTRAKATVELARARQENAKARSLEIKNEMAEELFRQLKERGIDLAGTGRDGQLHVAAVKEQPLELPVADAEIEKQKPRRKKAPSGASKKPRRGKKPKAGAEGE
jgi:hypothetical protein